MERQQLAQALEILGELLSERGRSAEVTVVGAGSLILTGLLERATVDLDAIAVRLDGDPASNAMPEPLAAAVRDVASLLGLADDWLNTGPADLAKLGLPDGFADRLVTRSYGTLTVHHAGRFDQICFKLYATIDLGPRSKHAADLRELAPTRDELLRAARWTRTHDPSDGFQQGLHAALELLGVDDHGNP